VRRFAALASCPKSNNPRVLTSWFMRWAHWRLLWSPRSRAGCLPPGTSLTWDGNGDTSDEGPMTPGVPVEGGDTAGATAMAPRRRRVW